MARLPQARLVRELSLDKSTLESNLDALQEECTTMLSNLTTSIQVSHDLRVACAEARELARAAEEKTVLVQGQLDDARWSLKVRTGDPEALAACGLRELEQTVDEVELAGPRLRAAVVEATRREVAEAALEERRCTVCCAAMRDTVLHCGHVFCGACAERMEACAVCRAEPIQRRTRAYI